MYISASTSSKIVMDCRLDDVDSLSCPFTGVLRFVGVVGALGVLGAVSMVGAGVVLCDVFFHPRSGPPSLSP